MSSTYALWSKLHGDLSTPRRYQASLLGPGLILVIRESFPRAAGLEVWLCLLLPEGAGLNHSQNLTHLSVQIHVLFPEPKHGDKETPSLFLIQSVGIQLSARIASSRHRARLHLFAQSR